MISIIAALIVWMRGARLINWLQDIFPEVAVALGVKFMRWPLLQYVEVLPQLVYAHRAHEHRDWPTYEAEVNFSGGSSQTDPGYSQLGGW